VLGSDISSDGRDSAFAFLRFSFRRAPLRRIAHRVFSERAVELRTIGQHNDGLRAALAFVHGEPDRLRPVLKQAAATASSVLDHPMSVMILPDE
jgi:hypothetical protein